jgi:hypothetical protein
MKQEKDLNISFYEERIQNFVFAISNFQLISLLVADINKQLMLEQSQLDSEEKCDQTP